MAFDTLAPDEIQGDSALVADNSVMMRWLFDDGSASDRRYAAKVLRHIQDSQCLVLVPYVWVYESAFVVNFYVGQGNLDWEQGASHLHSLHDLSRVIVDKQPPTVLFEFSYTHGVSAYDAAYLVLAREHDLSIASLGKKMRKVANKTGVGVFGA